MQFSTFSHPQKFQYSHTAATVPITPEMSTIAFFLGNSLMFLFGAVSSIYAGGNDIFEVMLHLNLFYIAVLVLGVYLVIYGIRFCNSPLSINGKYASIPTLSKFWQYLPVPGAGVSMIIFELEQIFRHLEAFWLPADDKNEKEAKA